MSLKGSKKFIIETKPSIVTFVHKWLLGVVVRSSNPYFHVFLCCSIIIIIIFSYYSDLQLQQWMIQPQDRLKVEVNTHIKNIHIILIFSYSNCWYNYWRYCSLYSCFSSYLNYCGCVSVQAKK